MGALCVERPRGRGGRVDIPDPRDLTDMMALQDHLVVACAGLRTGSGIALTIESHNGNQATLYLDQRGAMTLLDALRALLPRAWQLPPKSPATVRELSNGVVV